MKQLALLVYFAAALVMSAAACRNHPSASTDIHLAGSTPGDEPVKAMFGIPSATAIDFMRWDLSMAPNDHTFTLTLNYGTSVPNTQDLKDGGAFKKINGKYSSNEAIIHFNATDKTSFYLQRISENVYHLLDTKQELITGNGGWSYSLSRVEPVARANTWPGFKQLVQAKDTSTKIEFIGRTPCQIIAQQTKMNVSKECWKMKWLLVLKRDAQTGNPAGFQLKRPNINQELAQGNWQISKTTDGNILTLNLNNNTSLNFLIGNENVLFILDDQLKPLVGNSDMSFTLNRR